MSAEFTISFDKKLFNNPLKILRLDRPQDLQKFWQELTKLSKKYYLAGFFSYEFGYLSEDALKAKAKRTEFPYAFFGVYKKPTQN